MKRKEHGYITNRLLYQLSYVGLSPILNGRPESVKQQQAPPSLIDEQTLHASFKTGPRGLLPRLPSPLVTMLLAFNQYDVFRQMGC
jgi:hypothetical protein